MTDRLDAIKAYLERPEVLNTENGCSVANVGSGDVRWLVAEVERLREALAEMTTKRDALFEEATAAKRELAALRERHAEDVEHAFAAGVTFTATCTDQMSAGLRKWPEYKAKWARREP